MIGQTVAGNGDTGKSDDEPKAFTAELVVAQPDGLSPGLVADLRRSQEFQRQSRASNTRRGYAGDWARFQAWATANRVPFLPAPPEVVAAHLSWLAAEGYSVSTISRFLSAAGHYHDEAGLDFVRNARVVRQTLKGIRNTVGVKQTKKAPLGIKVLIDVCARLGVDAEGARNRAMLTVGWFCALRSANLVAIRREHVRFVRVEEDCSWIEDLERSNGIMIYLPSSKTDQAKEGRDAVSYAQEDESVCPMKALFEHFRLNRFKPDDLIFPISERTVSRLVKRLAANPDHGHKSMREISECESCVLLVRRFASHSLRRGVATTFAQKGTAQRDLMRHVGWESEKVARGYIEHATPFENNPTKGLTSK